MTNKPGAGADVNGETLTGELAQPHTRAEDHTHSFSVDTSCDCGIMLSEYVRGIVAALKAQAMTQYTDDGSFCWCDKPPILSTALVHSAHCRMARAALAGVNE